MSDDRQVVGEVDEHAFPRAAAAPVKLQFLLHYAVQAPSPHNTQPWAFKLTDRAVELYLERQRVLPVTDPQGREAVISCGAALFYLRTALRYFGYTGVIEPCPPPHTPDLLARVCLGRRRVPTDTDRRLFRAMRDRHTNRLPFVPEVLPAALGEDLHTAAQQEGVWLRLLADPAARAAIAELIAAGDQRQWADPQFRQEQSAWIRLVLDERQDGIPSRNLGLGELEIYTGRQGIGSVGLAERRAAQDRLLAEHAPLLAVLYTAGDSPLYWLVAGQALAHMLLRATAAGVAASFLNQPIQVPALRARLNALLGSVGYAQVLLRLGHGPDVPQTPRRDACQVLR